MWENRQGVPLYACQHGGVWLFFLNLPYLHLGDVRILKICKLGPGLLIITMVEGDVLVVITIPIVYFSNMSRTLELKRARLPEWTETRVDRDPSGLYSGFSIAPVAPRITARLLHEKVV